MLIFNSQSFNSDYLTALNLCLIEPHNNMHNTRAGNCIYLGNAIFKISPNDSRLIFLKNRNLNLQFAIQEAVWILSGDNSLRKLSKWIKNYHIYSDDKETLNGAYGFRLQKYFDNNQIDIAIKSLKENPNSRRVVLTMYAVNDLNSESLDIPCNTHIYLQIIDNKLDITICNRSNDLYLGIPYNIFVFGILQKYLAIQLNIEVGNQIHFTNNLHVYHKNIEDIKSICLNNSIPKVRLIDLTLQWNYSEKIILNMENIQNENYENILDIDLKNIFKKNLDMFVDNAYKNFYNFGSNSEEIVMPSFQDIIFKNHNDIINFVDNEMINKSDLLDEIINNFNNNSNIYQLNQNSKEKIKIGILLNSIWSSIPDTSIIRSDVIGIQITDNWNTVLKNYNLSFEDILKLPIISND